MSSHPLAYTLIFVLTWLISAAVIKKELNYSAHTEHRWLDYTIFYGGLALAQLVLMVAVLVAVVRSIYDVIEIFLEQPEQINVR